MLVDVRIDGEKVRAAREQRFLSQRELADRAELNHNTVWRIETSGLTDVHPRTIRKIAEALSVDPTSLTPQSAASEQDTPNGQAEKPASSKRGGAGKARKSQVDLLKTLAVEWRGENGVERLENRLGKPLKDMTRAEADEWIDRLTPEGRE